ncbi:MAG TPA: PfkB family carbohydrate kinase, partial [Sphingomonas sp.]
TPNESETATLLGGGGGGHGDAASRLMAMGARGVVLKLGAAGCIVAEPGVPETAVAAARVTAVDTTAAGDAFNAGFAVGLARGQDAVAAARFATIVAGLSVTRRGAQPSMPSAQDVQDHAAMTAAGAA